MVAGLIQTGLQPFHIPGWVAWHGESQSTTGHRIDRGESDPLLPLQIRHKIEDELDVPLELIYVG